MAMIAVIVATGTYRFSSRVGSKSLAYEQSKQNPIAGTRHSPRGPPSVYAHGVKFPHSLWRKLILPRGYLILHISAGSSDTPDLGTVCKVFSKPPPFRKTM